jgi:hypothetical protein
MFAPHPNPLPAGERERTCVCGHFEVSPSTNSFVMPGLVPGIHVFLPSGPKRKWMAGTSPAMTAAAGLRLRSPSFTSLP